jgi:hypothetical protein
MVSGIGSIEHAMYISTRLRHDGIKAEMFLDQNMSLDNQIEYAKKRGFKLFAWTEGNVDGIVRSEDLIMLHDLRSPSSIQTITCWGFFTSVKAIL